MDKALNFEGKKFISAKNAAKIFGYTSDYVGQLCRQKKIDARLVGRSWYVCEKDIADHKINHKNFDHPDKSNKSEKITRSLVEKNKTKNAKIKAKKLIQVEVFVDEKEDLGLLSEPPISAEKSRLSEIDIKKPLYIKDNKPLFPIIHKKVDPEALKYAVFSALKTAQNKPKQRSNFDLFTVSAATVILAITLLGSLLLNANGFKNLSRTSWGGKIKSELAFVYKPYLDKFEIGFKKFEQNLSDENKFGNQLASSVFSTNSLQSVWGWYKDLGYKIIKPWIEETSPQPSFVKDNPPNPPYIKGGVQTTALTTIVGADKNYVDAQISELKKYFLSLPSFNPITAPNVNRYYVTRQNDVIVGRTTTTTTGGGTSNVANLSDLSDLTLTSLTYGDLLMYNGSKWVNTATSSLGITGSGASFGKTWEIDTGGFLAPTTTITTLFNNGFLSTASSTLSGNTYLPALTQGFAYTGTGGKINTIASSSVQLSWFNNDSGFLTSATGLTSYDAWTHPAAGYSATTSALSIGTTSAWAKLSVSSYSDGANTNPLFVVASSTGTSATTTAFIINSIGNVGIGVANPTAQLTIKSLAANESGSLGAELLDGTGWTSTDWTGDFATGFTHTTGNTTALSRTTTVSASNSYQISFDITTSTGGSLTVALGNATTTHYISGSNGTVTVGHKPVTSNGPLVITPSSAFDGTISNISMKQITAYGSTFTILDSTNTATLEVRSSPTTLRNSFIGLNAGRMNTTGAYNSTLGNHTFYFNTTGSYNNAFGYQTLYFNTTGSNNSAFGNQALISNTTGTYNSAVGSSALYSNISGTANTAIGASTIYLNTTGINNSALGYSALRSNTTGSYNNAFGYASLYSGTTGSYNSGLGYYSLGSNTTGSYNTALGNQAGNYNNSATSTTLIGAFAGRGISSGYGAGELTAVGAYSLYNIQTGSEDNTTLGYRTGYNLTTGANNILLGYQAGEALLTGSNNIVIGYDIDTPTTTSSNTLNIGNLLFGTGLDGSGTTLSTGNIAIGTTTPYSKLTLWGSGSFFEAVNTSSTTIFSIGQTGATTTNFAITGVANTLLKTNTNGSVIPAIAGTDYLTSATGLTSYDAWTHPAAGYSATTSALAIGTSSAWAKLSISSYSDGANTAPLFVVASSTGTSATSTAFIINSIGNVGIGTANPTYPLDVAGNARVNGLVYLSGTTYYVGSGTSNLNGLALNTAGTAATPALRLAYAGSGLFTPSAGIIGLAAGGVDGLYQNTGNVGIGTTTPQYRLTIASSTALTDGAGIAQWVTRNAGGNLYFATTTVDGTATTSTSALSIIGSSGNVGIGTANPSKLLHLQSSDGAALRLSRNDSVFGNNEHLGDIEFYTNDGSPDSTGVAGSISYIGESGWGGTFQYGRLGFFTTNFDVAGGGGAANGILERMSINNAGNIGIGTTTPAWQLQVSSTTASATFKPQLALSDYSASADLKHWTLSSQGGNFYIASATDAYATTTDMSALSISGTGFGTTTVRGLNISGQATSTSNVGINISGGCFAIGGNCISASSLGALSSYDAWTHPAAGQSATTSLMQFFANASTSQFTATSSVYLATLGGNVGIGTTTPWGLLSVNPNTLGSGVPEFVVGSSSATHLVVTQAGRVGIGLASPSGLLDVNDNNKRLTISQDTSYPLFSFQTRQTSGSGPINSIQFISQNDGNILNDGATFFEINPYGIASNANVFRVQMADNTKFIIKGDGNIGIGTSTPFALLQLSSTTASATFKPQLALSDYSAGTNLKHWTLSSQGGNFYIASATDAYATTTGMSALTILNNGNVGIGTTTPWGLLSVNANALTAGTPQFVVGSSTATNFIVANNGNVGIGNSSPSYPLQITSTLAAATTTPLTIQNANVNTYTTVALRFAATTAPTANQNGLLDLTGTRQSDDSMDFNLMISPGGAAAPTSRLFVDGSSGNIGIGTTGPGSLLHLYSDTAGSLMVERSSNGNADMEFKNTGGSTYVGRPLATASLAFGIGSNVDLSNSPYMVINTSGNVGIGTTTPFAQLQISSTTASATFKPQLALSDYSAGTNLKHWTLSSQGGNFYIASATDAYATTSISALEISGTGFGTTTVRGLNISGQATSTSNVGFNITTGCYAVSGVCVGGGGSGSGTVNSGVFGQLAFYGANGTAVTGTSTITIATTTNSGRVGIATTTNLNATLTLQGASGLDILRVATSTSGGDIITISQWGGFVQKVASTTALSIQMASGTPVFEIDTTQSNSNAGIDITAATGQTANLLNMYSSGGSFLSGFTAAGGLFMNISSTTAINMYDGSGNAAFVINSTAGDVGIGTSTLAYDFTVQGNQAATYIARIDNANAGTDADGLLITLGVANASRTTSNYFIGFATGDKTVAGKIQGGANAVAYTTTSADLAEFFRISDLGDRPGLGEIVAIDKSKENSVLRAAKGDSRMSEEPLGIVSTNPGFVGNGPICKVEDENCDENYSRYNVLISIVGQVPVRVSLENGPIEVGDYLTLSSTTPGTAVKMIESGYIVGVAITGATTTAFKTPEPSLASSTPQNIETVTAYIKSGWRDIESQKVLVSNDGLTQTLVPSKWFVLFDFFKKIGIEISQGLVKVANLVTEKLVAQKVETQELCLDDVCVNKDQLTALLLNAGITPNATSTPSTGSGQATSTPPAETTATTTTDSVVPMPEITPTPSTDSGQAEPTATTTAEAPLGEPEVIPTPTEPETTQPTTEPTPAPAPEIPIIEPAP